MTALLIAASLWADVVGQCHSESAVVADGRDAARGVAAGDEV